MKSIKKPILEFIPVFLGVVLALFFNNINENRIDRSKIEGLLSKIERGTSKNIDNLNLQLQQNQRVMDSLEFYQDDSSTRIADIISRSRGIRYIQYDLAAWNVLKSSELLIDVDYELVSLLYLLNESIDNQSTVQFEYKASSPLAKEELISDLSDYLVDINHRIYLCKEIQRLLKDK